MCREIGEPGMQPLVVDLRRVAEMALEEVLHQHRDVFSNSSGTARRVTGSTLSRS
jgi:hypothetical protein